MDENESVSAENTQAKIFLETEGDQWWQRNSQGGKRRENFATEFIIDRLGHLKESIDSVLEIGCSNAEKLQDLALHFNATAIGIDPSRLAIEDARSRFQSLGIKNWFSVGISSSLPVSSSSIDLVFLGFFLYLIPTAPLSQTFKEADRVLRHGGFMVIEDFDPGTKYINPYIHNENVKTYKDDYARYLLNNERYHLIEKISYSHSGHIFVKDSDERLATQIFYKG